MGESREQRIATLANTLKTSGIAKSDSQARMMAEDMIGVEEHVQKHYEVEHARSTEYLNTAKNLGDSRPVKQPVTPVSMVRESPRDRPKEVEQSKPVEQKKVYRMIEPIPTSDTTSSAPKISEHETGNPAIEAIKQQMSKEYIKPLYDQYEELTAKQKVSEMKVEKETVKEVPKAEDIKKELPKAEEIKEDKVQKDAEVKEEPIQAPKLDAQKLIDMMEEDGKMEEHTREIKEKPKDVKPKEAYVENSIDLGSMFNFNKK